MVQWYQELILQAHHGDAFRSRQPRNQTFPPGHDSNSFKLVLDEFRVAIGPDNVVTGDDLAYFRDPYPLYPAGFEPSAGLCPETVEEIQSNLKVARDHQVPLWVCSQGKNFVYGGPAPRVAGSVVLCLQRMKRILEVNEQLAYIVVEPGVTFFEICKYFEIHWPERQARKGESNTTWKATLTGTGSG